MDISNFNVIKWVVKQPKDILVGIVIFTSSYLFFLSQYKNPISIGEHFLWFLLFFTSSLLVGFFVSFLCKQAYVAIRSNWVANNKTAIIILKSINKIENDLSQDSLQVGYSIPFSVDLVSENSGVCLSTIRYYRDSLSEIDFIKVSLHGKIVGFLPQGRKFMKKKNLINKTH